MDKILLENIYIFASVARLSPSPFVIIQLQYLTILSQTLTMYFHLIKVSKIFILGGGLTELNILGVL